MKKFLPNQKGFTLIEILVVVTIIAVLSVIAFAVFSGLGGQGNDARRTADIKALADALEVKQAASKTYNAQTIAAADFGTGVFPKEPTSRTVGKYCFSEGAAPIANPAPWVGTACPTGWTSLDGSSTLTTGSTTTNWKFCTLNNGLTAVTCYGNRQ